MNQNAHKKTPCRHVINLLGDPQLENSSKWKISTTIFDYYRYSGNFENSSILFRRLRSLPSKSVYFALKKSHKNCTWLDKIMKKCRPISSQASALNMHVRVTNWRLLLLLSIWNGFCATSDISTAIERMPHTWAKGWCLFYWFNELNVRWCYFRCAPVCVACVRLGFVCLFESLRAAERISWHKYRRQCSYSICYYICLSSSV